MSKPLDVWILAGQSNMQGCGLLPREPVPPASDVLSFSSSGEWVPAQEPLHRLWESFTPVNQELMRSDLPEADQVLSDGDLAQKENRGRVVGSGLGLSFGRAMATALNTCVGLIPAAHGGTSLDQWSPEYAGDSRTLYEAMLERLREANRQHDMELRGVLWYQGESDCYPASAVTYLDRMTRWVERLRHDTHQPELPIHMVQLSRVIMNASEDLLPGSTPGAWDTVREAQRELAASIAHCSIISAIDLRLSDPIHLSAASLERLGRRLARAVQGETTPSLLAIERKKDSVLGYPVVRVRCQTSSGWSRSDRIWGFEMRNGAGGAHPLARIIDTDVAPDDPNAIDVQLTTIDEDTWLGYGLGFDPPANLVDRSDMAMVAFEPQRIPFPQSDPGPSR